MKASVVIGSRTFFLPVVFLMQLELLTLFIQALVNQSKNNTGSLMFHDADTTNPIGIINRNNTLHLGALCKLKDTLYVNMMKLAIEEKTSGSKTIF